MLTEIRGALDAHPREALTDILAQLFKEYVVDGPAPVGAGAALLLHARNELEGMSFPQLIQWLQSHLDVPELSQFDVQGDRVSVRIAGRLQPIEAPSAQPLAATPTPAAAPAVEARPMPVSQTPPVATAPRPAQPTPAQPAAAPAAQPATRADDAADPNSRFSYLEVD